MKEPKVIGVSCSDGHFANWKQFNKKSERLQISVEAFKTVIEVAASYHCPLFFSGDWIDHPKHADNIVLEYQTEVIAEARNQEVIIVGINGNHDFYKKSSYNNQAKGYMSHLGILCPEVICIDYSFLDFEGCRVHGIPYINGNVDFLEALELVKGNLSKYKKNILLIHTDLPNAVEADGREVKTSENIKNYKIFKPFDLVLSGHIHRYQKLYKNVYMVGSMMQQRRSDAGVKMGYCLIYENMTVKHVSLDLPEFKFYDYGTEHPDTPDFWIERPAPITIVDPTNAGLHFDVKSDRKTLAKNYMKAKGIKNKSKRELLIHYLND